MILILVCSPAVAGSFPDSVTNKLDVMNANQKVNYLAKLCWNLREKNGKMALEYGEKAFYIATEEKMLNMVAQISNYLGVVHLAYNRDTKAALFWFRNAVETAIQIKDTLQLGYSNNNLGDLFLLSENYELGLEYSKKALNFFRNVGDETGMAYAYLNLGDAYLLARDFSSSIKYYKKSYRLREKMGNELGLAICNSLMAEAYFRSKDYSMSMSHFQIARNIYSTWGNEVDLSDCDYGIARSYFGEKQYTEALKYYNIALETTTALNYERGMFLNHIGIALVYSILGDKQKGEYHLDKAYELAAKQGDSKNIYIMYKTLYEFYDNLGDYQTSTRNFGKFIAINDSLHAIEKVETLLEQQENYDFRQRIEEIQYDLKFSEQRFIYLVVIAALLIISMIFIFLRYKTSRTLNRKLAALNSAKDTLFRVISHDLKAPFNSMMGFSSMLYNDFETLSEEEKRESLLEINNSSNKVYNLLENLLDWSRVQTNDLEANLIKLEPSRIISQNTNIYEQIALQKNITIDFCPSETQCHIIADEYMLGAVVRNLLYNSLKYTPNGGAIKIKYLREADDVIFEFSDTGIGMDDVTVEHILSDKNLVSKGGTNNEKGTGFGLLLCRDFIRRMNGELWVESSLGEGSTFYFKLQSC